MSPSGRLKVLACSLAVATAALTGCASRAVTSAAPAPAPDTPTAAATPASPSRAVLPATPATPTAPTGPGAPATWPSGMPPGQLALDQAVDKVRPLLEGTYADWYTGLELQQPDGPTSQVQSALVIHRIPHQALDDAVRGMLPGVTVRFVDGKYSQKQTLKFQNEVSFGYWKDRGLQINSLGCYDGTCTFGVDDPDKWRAALQGEYGADRVVVIKQGPVGGL